MEVFETNAVEAVYWLTDFLTSGHPLFMVSEMAYATLLASEEKSKWMR